METGEKTKRTNKQNRALHLWFTMLAEHLNDAGFDMRIVLKPQIEIPWDTESVKNFIWRPVQEAQLGKKSTTDLTTEEIDKVYETITRHLAERFDFFIDFPSIEQLRNLEDDK